jgi:hypothetical protein
MEIPLRDFLADQLLGLDGLINLANIFLLSAFSMRDLLKLRNLAPASDVMTVQGLEKWRLSMRSLQAARRESP